MHKILLKVCLVFACNTLFAEYARYYLEPSSFLGHAIQGREVFLEGFQEISKDQIHQHYCYMFLYQDDHTLSLVHYLKNGRISRIPGADYSSIQILYQDGFEIRTYQDQFGNRVTDNQGVSVIRIKLDEQGRYTRAFFYDSELKLIRNKTAPAIISYSYDSQGRIVRQDYQDHQGGQMTGLGYSTRLLEYNPGGYVGRVSYLDTTGRLVSDSLGIAQIGNMIYSSNGEIHFISSYFNAQGVAVSHPELGAQTILTIMDDQEHILARHLLDSTEKQLVPWRVEKQKYSAQGYLLETAYYDAEGKPVNWKGWARLTYRRDKWGNILEKTFFSDRGELVVGEKGAARILYKYNKFGEVLSMRFLGIDELPITDTDGIAEYRYEYNPQGMMTRTEFYGVNRKLTGDEYGVSVYLMAYDEKGRVTDIRTLDHNQSALEDTNGVAHTRMQYEDDGRVRFYYFDKHGRILNIARPLNSSGE